MHLQNGESRAGSFFQEYLWENSVELFKDNLEYTQRQISNVLLEGKHSNSSGDFIVDWKISPTLSKVTDPDLRLTPFRWDEQKYTIEPSESGDPTRIWRYLDEYNLTGKIDITKTYSLFSRESKEMSNLRFSLSRTIARPSFKEKSIAQIFDPVTSTTFIGNIDILPTKILNYDLRWELFQENAQMYAISLFYKDFKNPIELAILKNAILPVEPT